ncbi:mechanosensitive ion channel [Flavobacteriaceae bacterium Ap0902]|nr:mechanosensitive ion channel [Flavobacteriaceae bacterium Ap0902]
MTQKEKHKPWIIIYGGLSILFLAAYYLLDLAFFQAWGEYIPSLKKLTITLFLISFIYLIGKILSRIINKQNYLEGDKYNLLRIIRFLSISLSMLVIFSVLFQNLYAAAVSFGLISLVLGFALQAPITSFIAWIYLIFRRSYLVGDRIQIKDFKGDVIEISYLDTTIIEFSGVYLGNDHASGRIVRFPNSLILREEVFNYSGPQNPFIWNEVPIQLAYSSDLEFVENALIDAAIRDFKERYPLYDSSGRWKPAVYFRVNSYAWMEAVITYPVMPKDTSTRRNKILKTVLPIFNANPDKIKLPEGGTR